MSKNARRIVLLALVAVLAVDLVAVAYAVTRGGGPNLPKLPGRVAVRDGCGLKHMWPDGTDQRQLCLQQSYDQVSLSWNGKELAWDTAGGSTILYSGVDGKNPSVALVPTGANVGPSLSPDGSKMAFLHSPQDDGRYDIWIGSVGVDNAQQVTTTRNVSDIAWAPTGDWLALVRNWSENTLEGQIALVHPNGDGAHTILQGDEPDWSPDGKQVTYFHAGGIWIANADGSGAHRVTSDGHSPAWSRDGKQIAFMRPEKCGKAICSEHVFLVFTDGTQPRQIGPAFRGERRVLWLPDPNE